jgi:hypothetical protein
METDDAADEAATWCLDGVPVPVASPALPLLSLVVWALDSAEAIA